VQTFKPAKRWLSLAVSAALLLQSGQASAIGLLQAYDAALKNDPTFQAARFENEAGQQNRALGRASLLPQISASYYGAMNRSDVTYVKYYQGKDVTVPRDYNSRVASVSLKQPIISLEGIARYRQGIAQSDYSNAVFVGKREDLILRLVGAYTDAQLAQDQMLLATAQRDAYVEQMKVNKRMFDLGEGTKTDMLETQAKAELSEAQVIEARDNLANARNALAGIIGIEAKNLDGLSPYFKPLPLPKTKVDEWLTLALEKNAELVAQRHAVEAARLEVHKQRSGHAPRLDLIASYSDNKSESLSTYNQTVEQRAIGLQLSVPIYSGGYVSAATSQAIANHSRAKAELDAKISQVTVELRKQHALMTCGTAKIDALMKAVDSARTLVTATQKSIQGGVRVNLDLLNAQQQLYTAQRDLAQARYHYLLAYLRLHNAAGVLTANEVQKVAGHFVPAK